MQSARWRAWLAAAAIGLGLLAVHVPSAWADDDKAAIADLEEADRLEKEVERLTSGGMWSRAVPLAEQALSLREKRLGPSDPKVASSLSDLGALYYTNGDPLRAEPLLLRAYEILKKSPHATQQQIGVTLANLAAIARGRGEYTAARSIGESSVAALRKAGPGAEGELAASLRGLAGTLTALGMRAEPIYAEALEISRRLGKNELAVLILTDLGTIERAAGKAVQAAQHYNEALDLSQKTLGPDHHVVGNLLHRIGRFYHRDRNYPEAERYYQRASSILEAAYGPGHRVMSDLLSDWSLLREATADIPGAVELRARANEIDQRYLDLVLTSGNEEEKQRYALKLRRHLEDTIWLHAGRGASDRGALRLALTTLLRMKGRVLDALADDVSVLRGHLGPEERRLLDELARTRTELSALYVRGPTTDPKAYQARRRELTLQEARLEAEMSEKSAELRAATADVTIEAVQAALPEGSALVEIFRFQPHDARAYSEQGSPLGRPRYIAYVLKRTGEPRFTHVLANADDVDTVLDQVRGRIQVPTKEWVYDAADRLNHLFMRRVNELLGDTRDVFLSPDGKLSLLPFGALVENGHFLIERYTYTYLTSGRDLLRLAAKPRGPSRSAPMILANPTYDKVDAPAALSVARGRNAARGSTEGALSPELQRAQHQEAPRMAIDPSMVGFSKLPGTAAEAKAIRTVVPGAVLRLGPEAHEAALKAVSGPKFLHIATHGFFFGTIAHGAPAMEGVRSVRTDDPLVRSGLALAGANLHPATGEDGILTALEASTLDLQGTELVVLSACETGVGEDTALDGVRGLRRALVVAGSETQVMSLWKVDDEATRDMMTSFYGHLFRDGMGRSEAMRKAQLELLGQKTMKHPFYWASFIVSGAPGPLSKDSRWTTPPEVARGPRGCSCEAVGRGDERLSGWWVMGALGLSRLRRRSS